MRTLFVAVLGTLVGGLLLYAGQVYLDKYLHGGAQIEHYAYKPEFYLDAKKAAQWADKIPKSPLDEMADDGRMTVVAVVIENTGPKAIEDQRVVIKPKYADQLSAGVLDFQNDLVPGAEGIDTKMSISDKSLIIDYKLLNPDEFHRFFIVKDRFSELSFNIRKPGLEVVGWDAKIYTKKDDAGLDYADWSGLVALGLGALLVGAFWSFYEGSQLLKLQGLDYEDLIKKGNELKKKQKLKDRQLND